MTDKGERGFLDRLRARYGWLDHALRANERYADRSGNFFAAGMSYYTIFALFPLLMVGFSVGGFLLSRRPALLDGIQYRIRHSIPGELGDEVIKLMDSAISSRTSVGFIGLAVAVWVGMSWMANLREALTQMTENRGGKPGFVHGKLSDLAAMISAFVAMVATIALTALGDSRLMAKILHRRGIPDFALAGALLRTASLVAAVAVSWAMFTWMIARLPREPIGLPAAARAGMIAAVGYEVFKQVGSVYLQSVVEGPAGVVFGPVLGVLVFAYITTRLLLFATAWAAVAPRLSPAGPPPAPAPAG